MRRKDREQSTEFALKTAQECEFAVISMIDASGLPYGVPVSTVLDGKTLYFHTAKEGRKIDCLHHSPAVHIVCVGAVQRASDEFTTGYECAMIEGICTEVTDEAEKIRALRLLCKKYTPQNMDNFDRAIQASLHRTGVYKIAVLSVTGKAKILKS